MNCSKIIIIIHSLMSHDLIMISLYEHHKQMINLDINTTMNAMNKFSHHVITVINIKSVCKIVNHMP